MTKPLNHYFKEQMNYNKQNIKWSSILILILFIQPIFSQELSTATLEKIYDGGKSFTTPLKQGQIESLKKANPPKDTWLYSKLEEYKNQLDSENIIYGEIVMPSADEKFYSYNLFAYDIKKEFYYFVAIVSFEITNSDAKMKTQYLFTEKKSLKDWWKRAFGFYESELIKKIPEKYLFKTCPPPPFKD
ncbi:hypothetical protein [Aquimarina sp. AU474]|uniref:hypothetical protein n=1 Tax=Aquimarina sp. AU474 TaxID=2108529 RepID=UPI00135AA92A|nr:hypothetical protein [Aquimarina sp. AU474]